MIVLHAGWENNSIYIIHENDDAIIIDPCENYKLFLEELEKINCKNLRILLTHGHEDHISAIPGLIEKYNDAKILIHQNDYAFLTDPVLNGSKHYKNVINLKDFLKNVELIKGGDFIKIGQQTLEVFETPGHTKGSVIFIDDANKCVYTGDTLFKGTVGATHFPGGDAREMMNSLINITKRIPDDYTIYPGHEKHSTMKQEKASNKFIQEALKHI